VASLASRAGIARSYLVASSGAKIDVVVLFGRARAEHQIAFAKRSLALVAHEVGAQLVDALAPLGAQYPPDQVGDTHLGGTLPALAASQDVEKAA
jgi:hypothetical protein